MMDYPSELMNSFEILDRIEFGAYGWIDKVMKKSNAYLGDHKLYAMKVVRTCEKSKEIFKSMQSAMKVVGTCNNSEEIVKSIESELEVLSWVYPYKLHLDCFFEDENNTYMIIDYCENGELLKDIVNKSKNKKHFKEDEIWKYFIQICFALEFLNSRGFIHNGLHPKNIFLDENGDIKLGDFVISNYLDNTMEKVPTMHSSVSWKKKYENKEGDIWAAGCVLYYLLTLTHPFEGNLKKGENYKPITLNYSDKIKSIVGWCLNKKRNERFRINQILTHEFIVNKTMRLGIKIPQKSVMRTIYNPMEEIKKITSPLIDIPLLKSNNKTPAKNQNIDNTLITLEELKEKKTEILNRPIDTELEKDFRRICSIYENDTIIHDQPLIQAYQEYINTYHWCVSICNIGYNEHRSQLVIYNTENERTEIKILETQEQLDLYTCIARLPDGKLFCFSNYNFSGITLIVDENGRVKTLPSGIMCCLPALIYFNSSVYRFGGMGEHRNTAYSERFDLVKNQWFRLPPMPKADWFCSGIIFNKNFLLSGNAERNILIYSNDIESYSVISYNFEANKEKILTSAEKRLYLIEWGLCGLIYESEVEDEYNWKRISGLKFNVCPVQNYFLYNKGAIYIEPYALWWDLWNYSSYALLTNYINLLIKNLISSLYYIHLGASKYGLFL